MIVLLGRPPLSLDRAGLLALASAFSSVAVDLGTGTGEWVYREARKDPESLWLGIDASADSLNEIASRVARKPARGGIPNARFVTANVEALPEELDSLADHISVNFPWGSLLRGLVMPESPAVLASIRRIAKPGARVHLLLNTTIASSVTPGQIEARVTQELPRCDAAYVEDILATVYLERGLKIVEHRGVSPEETREIGTAWAKRLAHSRDPGTMLIEARVN